MDTMSSVLSLETAKVQITVVGLIEVMNLVEIGAQEPKKISSITCLLTERDRGRIYTMSTSLWDHIMAAVDQMSLGCQQRVNLGLQNFGRGDRVIQGAAGGIFMGGKVVMKIDI